jgi:hypothetical protein
MSQGKKKYYEVYRDAEKIGLEKIIWESEETSGPSLRVRVSIDDRTIENVTFKRDIRSKAYAMPPAMHENQSSEVTILFGGEVQEILDNFADYILPPMKPLGLNPLTGEQVLDPSDRITARQIMEARQKVGGHKYVWQNNSNR